MIIYACLRGVSNMNIRINFNERIISLLFIIGLFFPSSSAYIINGKNKLVLSFFILIFFILILFVKNGVNVSGVKYAILIISLTLLFTLLGLFKYNEIAINTSLLIQIIIFSLILMISYTKIKITKNIIYLFNIVNIINIALGLLIILNNMSVKDFFMKYYSAFYPELMSYMLMNNKPVLYFGSHSIAGFFIYLFFYMNFLLYKKNKSKLNLIFILLNIFLLLNIKSVTSIILFAVATIQLFYYFRKSKKALLIILPLIIYIFVKNSSYIYLMIDKIFSSDINGFAGRYSDSGVFQQDFEYLKNNLLPIGVLTLDQLYYTDNGFILNFIAGSVFLVFTIYRGLYSLFTHNIKNRKTSLWLFILFFSFEWAFPNLYYIRTLYFLPFLVVFVMYTESIEAK